MLRPSAVSALGVAAILSSAATGCSAPQAASRESPSLTDVARSSSFLVDPGTLDVENVYLPAVLVLATIVDSSGKLYPSACSGVFVHPRVVITAGHCLCLVHPPTPQDERRPEKPAKGEVVTRAHELQGAAVTGILDKRSSCAQLANVFTLAYHSGTDGGSPTVERDQYSGHVQIHPEIELISGKAEGQTKVRWNNADLAAIVLDQPVPPGIEPLALPGSEVEVGDDLVMVGYGTVEPMKRAMRQSGVTEVMRVLELETGSVLFGAKVAPGDGQDVVPVARRGDSGGACVLKKHPNVLLGIITMQTEMPDGTQMVLFTSTFSQKHWLEDTIRQADLALDGGVAVPRSDAGSTPSPRPAAR